MGKLRKRGLVEEIQPHTHLPNHAATAGVTVLLLRVFSFLFPHKARFGCTVRFSSSKVNFRERERERERAQREGERESFVFTSPH